MSLTAITVENAALEWFRRRQGYAGQVGELGYTVGHGPQLAPGEPAAEREQGWNIEHRTPNIQRRREERRAGS